MKLLSLLLLIALVEKSFAQVDVESGATSEVPIKRHYASLAVEWQGVNRMFLQDYTKVEDTAQVTRGMLNDRALELVRNLGVASKNKESAIAVIRVGGNSATRMYWKPSLAPWSGVAEDMVPVGPLELRVLNQVALETNTRLLLNIGMRTSSPSGTYTNQILEAIRDNINPLILEGIELGNEPDHYNDNGNLFRPITYNYDSFLLEYREYAQVSNTILPGVAVAGPGMDPGNFDGRATTFSSDASPTSVGFVTLHTYELPACNVSLSYTLEDLLAYVPSRYERLTETVRTTKAANPETQVIFSEFGSASCGGVPGVSNAFGSGLWVLRAAFETAFRGIDYACFSGSPQAAYGPITRTPRINGVQTTTINPAYYGLLMFNLATAGANTAIFPVASGNSRVHYWVARNAESTTLVVINTQNSAVSGTVKVPFGNIHGQVIRLSSPGGAAALAEFSLGGLDFNAVGVSTSTEEKLSLVGGSEAPFDVAAESVMALRMSVNDLGSFLPDSIIQSAAPETNSAISGSTISLLVFAASVVFMLLH
ncbi:MAG: hypothetical protein SGCHY_005207 [Lobulomycetales sp.]